MPINNDTGLDEKWGTPHKLHDPFILANFKARSSDVLITTAPKAGTTWMQQILHQLKSGGDPNFYSIDDVVPWLEITRYGKDWESILSEFDKIKNPRLFKTHCTYPQTPGADIAKIIMTSRDPRDCCVSFYHHIMDMTDEAKKEVGFEPYKTFDDVFMMWMDFGAWYNNIKSWWPHINDSNVLWLRYEDLKTDFETNLDKIIHFLGWHLSKEHRDNVLNYCSFNWMKANTEKFTRQSGFDKPVFKPGGFIRKGVTGDHKNTLSTTQEYQILNKAKEILSPECLSFLNLT